MQLCQALTNPVCFAFQADEPIADYAAMDDVMQGERGNPCVLGGGLGLGRLPCCHASGRGSGGCIRLCWLRIET